MSNFKKISPELQTEINRIKLVCWIFLPFYALIGLMIIILGGKVNWIVANQWTIAIAISFLAVGFLYSAIIYCWAEKTSRKIKSSKENERLK